MSSRQSFAEIEETKKRHTRLRRSSIIDDGAGKAKTCPNCEKLMEDLEALQFTLR